ncbi:MAG: 50S ribosomal protein L21 [Vicinamibacterales bacterium]
MFAVIAAQGHQYRVEPGFEIELDGTGEKDQSVTFDQVLVVGTDGGEVKVGAPTVDGAKVLGVVVEPHRGPKVRVFKKKRRKQYRRTAGHRSELTRVRITEIVA